ncbi:unnamed protein product [Rotaria sordida]|uniref:Uncharacterized protein n=1 Tax=Rotaria sordida TaxID=392033 RepID=A0A815J639_9BILA|nr:unnamed protein product [Rotaria sordida]
MENIISYNQLINYKPVIEIIEDCHISVADIQNALAIVGYPVTKKNLPEPNENSTQPKRKRCSICECSMDKKPSTQYCDCSAFVCNEHSVKRIFCVTCSK